MPKTPISKIEVVGATTALQSAHPNTAMYSFASKVGEIVGETEGKGFLNPPSIAGSSRPMLHILLAQFQTRYPTAHLIAELLMVHEGSYVVRALVQTDGLAIASGMAAAPDIEQAEDRAKVRVLELLLIQPSASNPSVSSDKILSDEILSDEILSDKILSDEYERSMPSVSHLSPEIASDTPSPDLKDFPAIEPEVAPHLDTNWSGKTLPDPADPEDLLPSEVEIASDPRSLPQDSVAQAPTSIKADATQPSPNSSTPTPNSSTPKAATSLTAPPSPLATSAIDLSDAIAQTTVELKRLGWSNAKGRDHLEQTYGKRSRQQLTDAELLDFLAYLEAQPLLSQTPF